MLFSNETILTIAKSARMLAFYLTDAGYDVVTVDCFADSDTRSMALAHRQVSSLALDDIKSLVISLKKRYVLKYVIYGSGFEPFPDSLNFLQANFQILGNLPATFNVVQNKAFFLRRLSELRIPYPTVSFEPPGERQSWLQKPLQGEGGIGICHNSKDFVWAEQKVFWQRYVKGLPMSVLFIAARDDIEVIGFQEQLPVDPHAAGDFVFTGVISEPELPTDIKARVTCYAKKLARSLCLSGLNSMDFIYQRGAVLVLEINARPSASLQLYDTVTINRHIQAVVFNSLNGDAMYAGDYRVYRILYAKNTTHIDGTESWPSWIVDRPVGGTMIGKGEPICSIIARASSRRQLLSCLDKRQAIIEQILNKGI